jgi:hypothetical protein
MVDSERNDWDDDDYLRHFPKLKDNRASFDAEEEKKLSADRYEKIDAVRTKLTYGNQNDDPLADCDD